MTDKFHQSSQTSNGPSSTTCNKAEQVRSTEWGGGGEGGGKSYIGFAFCYLFFFMKTSLLGVMAFETLLEFYKAKPNFLTFKDYMHENKFVPQY